MSRIIIDCETNDILEEELTIEESQKLLQDEIELKVKYSNITEEQEQLALLIIEKEDLLERINKLENIVLRGNK